MCRGHWHGGRGGGSWILTFSCVARLRLVICRTAFPKQIHFTPFHRFSPTLKSLYTGARTILCTQFFDLVFSFPLLEDLTLLCGDLSLGDDNNLHPPQTVLPSISPVFTGSLEFLPMVHTGITVHRLLDLPNGLCFKSLALAWHEEENLQWVKRLVKVCSRTLESLTAMCLLPHTFASVLRKLGTEPHS